MAKRVDTKTSLQKKLVLVAMSVALTFFMAQKIFYYTSEGLLELIVARINYPIMRLTTMVTDYIHGRAQHKLAYEDLEARYQGLREKYNNLYSQYVQSLAMRRHEIMGSELREFAERYELKDLIQASIVIRCFSNHEHYVLINRGAKHGIVRDMVAFYKFQILGKVIEVFHNYSKIQLITDEKCKVAAYTALSDALGIVQGCNRKNACKLEYVGRTQAVADNDLVISSGQGLIFPEGFCLGRICHHELKERELYHVIELEPLYNIDSIQSCLLLKRDQLNLC